MQKLLLTLMVKLFLVALVSGQSAFPLLLKPDRVFDGENIHPGYWVLVDSGKIVHIGAANSFNIPKNCSTVVLKGSTLMPGMIEGHSHIFLHP